MFLTSLKRADVAAPPFPEDPDVPEELPAIV
jgi:hypothetical protein